MVEKVVARREAKVVVVVEVVEVGEVGEDEKTQIVEVEVEVEVEVGEVGD